MTWQLASFALLAAALTVGFAWYERSRPPAKLVALVATLAALAALGRVAFAAVPNVKPTTDIVLIAGYALGAGPGFAVGALAALSSNFFFGQGPWTPWEMAAWGGAGLAGALLARATAGRIGRVPLAAACGIVGLAFGAFMDFGDWVSYSDHSSGWYLARAGTSLPFNVAHAVGNVVFALAFGLALLRALARFRQRLEVRWRRAPAHAGVTAGAVLALAVVLTLSGGDSARAASPATYLAGAQSSDGGFGAAPGRGSSQLYSGWAALGFAASGRNPLDVKRRGRSVIDYIRAGVGGLSDTGELERTILVLRSAGLSSRNFGGRDLRAALLRHRRGNGSFDDEVNLTAFGILALRASGDGSSAVRIRAAARWLAGQQNGDGGFNFAGRGGISGIDDTGGPLQALAAAGQRRTRAVDRAVSFLRRQQNRDGGFPLTPGAASNAQSTAWAVQGLIAAGRNPDRVRRNGRSPLGYLRSLTSPDGSVRYSRTSGQTPVWVTAQALTALARKPFPLGRVPRKRTRSAHSAAGRATRSSAHAAGASARGGAPGPWMTVASVAGLGFGLLLAPL
ncbi:MAG: energy-coupling factor transport system substrate-specific component [Solirubrobacteraceae bacterium]|nr:energy-coupling factor transport system substrate-specific component [Solirubrobacteraceae bacterium]